MYIVQNRYIGAVVHSRRCELITNKTENSFGLRTRWAKQKQKNNDEENKNTLLQSKSYKFFCSFDGQH